MSEEREAEEYELVAEQRLPRSGLLVQIDRGFEDGTYGVCVCYDDRAERSGFEAARRKAGQFCNLLRQQLGQTPSYEVGQVEDASRKAGPGRKRDLENTFLSFSLTARDGRFHDEEVRNQFQMATLRAGLAWDREEARAQTRRRSCRQEEFRGKLEQLLESDPYAKMDAAMRQCLVEDVTALAFPGKGQER